MQQEDFLTPQEPSEAGNAAKKTYLPAEKSPLVITAVVYGKKDLFATREMSLEEWEGPETVKRQGEMEICRFEVPPRCVVGAGFIEDPRLPIEILLLLSAVSSSLDGHPSWAIFYDKGTGSSGNPFPIRLYLDGEGVTPEGWIRCYTANQVLRYIRLFRIAGLKIDMISLGNDLGNDPVTGEKLAEGHTVLKWILNQLGAGNKRSICPLDLAVHTRDPIAADAMRSDWARITRWAERQRQR